jgi:hypothetical protein
MKGVRFVYPSTRESQGEVGRKLEGRVDDPAIEGLRTSVGTLRIL